MKKSNSVFIGQLPYRDQKMYFLQLFSFLFPKYVTIKMVTVKRVYLFFGETFCVLILMKYIHLFYK